MWHAVVELLGWKLPRFVWQGAGVGIVAASLLAVHFQQTASADDASRERTLADGRQQAELRNADVDRNQRERQPEIEKPTTGRVVGRVRLKTEKPLPDLAKAKVPAGMSLNESVVFDKEGGLANVFVYLRQPTFPIEPAKDVEQKPFVLSTDTKRFSPRAAIVRTGREIQLRVDSESLTNFRLSPIKNKTFNRFVEHNSPWKPDPFHEPEKLPIPVKSDIHPWLLAWLLPLDHPFGAVTDAEGRFEISGLPPGDHVFRVFHEHGLLEKSLTVTIKPDETSKIELAYEPNRFSDFTTWEDVLSDVTGLVEGKRSVERALEEADLLNWDKHLIDVERNPSRQASQTKPKRSEDQSQRLSEKPTTGRVVGSVRLKTEKPLPDLTKVVVPAEKSLDESLVFAKNGGLANVVVYLSKPKFAAAADRRDVTEPFVLKWDLKQVSPRVAVVPVGQSVVIDRRLATENTNFRSGGIKNDGVNLNVSPGETFQLKGFRFAESFPMQLKSDVHPWMTAWLLPLDHPFAAVTDAAGNFVIEGLPPGEHEFRVWHELAGYLAKSRRVTVKAGEDAKVDLEFDPKPFKLEEADVLNWPSRLNPVSRRDAGGLGWRRLMEPESVLWKPTTVAFRETPLSDVLASLSETHAMKLMLDESALPQRDARVTLRVEGELLVSVLPRILHGTGLSYVIDTDKETVWIATPEEVLRRQKYVSPSFADLLLKLNKADSLPWEKLLMGDPAGLGESAAKRIEQVNRLTKLLGNTDRDIQISSASALVRFEAAAAPARPELEKLVQSQQRGHQVRHAAYQTLFAISREELNTAPRIVEAWERLTDPGKAIPWDEFRWLWQFHPGVVTKLAELYPAAPVELRRRIAALSRFWGRGRRESQGLARLCLSDPDEPTRFVILRDGPYGLIETVRQRLNDESARCRVQAARWLLWSADDRDAAADLLLKEFGTEPTEAQQLVIETFSEHGKNQYRTLGHVRDVLLRRSVSNDVAVREAARRVLRLVPETKKTTAIQAALGEEFSWLRKSRDQGRLTEAQAIQSAAKQVDDWLSHNNPTDEVRARINHHAAHEFARWNLDQNVSLVRQYAAVGLKLDVDPARRADLHSLLGSTALTDPAAKSFVDQRRDAAKHWLAGYREVVKLSLPATAPEIPQVEEFQPQPGEKPEAEAARKQQHAAQVEAKQQAEFIRQMIQHRHQFARRLVETFRRDPPNEPELRKLASESLGDQSLLEALLTEGAKPVGSTAPNQLTRPN